MHSRTPAAVVALVTMGLLAGCTGTGGDDADPAALAERLATAKESLDTAEALDIALSTPQVPDGVSGLLEATGRGNHSPAFEGEITVSTGGSTLGADVVAVGGTVWFKTSFSPTFLEIDPAELQAPDPASLLDRDEGISRILVETRDLSEGDRSRDGTVVLTGIDGTLSGTVVQSVIPSADADADFAVSYRITDDDELRDATLSGPFYPGADDVTYTVAVAASDDPLNIEAPRRPTADE